MGRDLKFITEEQSSVAPLHFARRSGVCNPLLFSWTSD